MSLGMDWQKMSQTQRLKTVALWIDQNTRPSGIAYLLGISEEVLSKFVKRYLRKLSNRYAALALTEDQIDSRKASLASDESYPPFGFKRRLAPRKRSRVKAA